MTMFISPRHHRLTGVIKNGKSTTTKNSLQKDQDMQTVKSDIHTRPFVNTMRSRDGVILVIAAPGLKKRDFNLWVEDRIVHVSVSKPKKDKFFDPNKKDIEFNYNVFHREIALPVDGDYKIYDMKYRHGLLLIYLIDKATLEDSISMVETFDEDFSWYGI